MPRSILITGCSDGGLGAALAIAFHKAGYKVIASARNLDKLKEVTIEGIKTVKLDVLSEESLKECAAEVGNILGGKLDVLLNNAGAGYMVPVLDIDVAKAQQLFALNVWTLATTTQAFLPLLRAAPNGWIVNNTSCSAVVAVPFQGPYNASKAAASSLTQTLRLELQPLGITVVELRTAAVKSKFFQNQKTTFEEKLPASSVYAPAKEIVEDVMNGAPMRETAIPADVWAQQVVNDLSRQTPSVYVWRGGQASFIRWAQILPSYFFDGTISKLVSLQTITRLLTGKA